MLCKPRNKRATATTDENEKEVRRDPREFHNWAGRGAAKIILPEAISFSEVRILTRTFTVSFPVGKTGKIGWKYPLAALIGNRNFQLG